MARKKPKRARLAPEGGWPTPGKQVPAEARAEARGKQVPPLGVENEQVQKRRPVWRFTDLDDEGPWTLSGCSHADLPDIFAKLRTFETMTIGEIFAPGSEHGKTYSTAELPRPAQKRLEEIQKDDETAVSRLRFSGQKRFYGILREHVFHVLWWDPEHTVFPSMKKNT